MLVLHAAPNTISVAVAIALEEARVPYDIARVDFGTAEQTSARYLAVNPKGRVPALVTPDGTLTETGAILEYIAATSDIGRPADAFAAAKLREVMYYLAATMHVNHAHRMRGHRWADQAESHADMRAKVPQTMAASCAYLEDALTLAPFVGDDVSIVDGYLFALLTWLPSDGVDLADYPQLSAFAAMMRQRASVRAVVAKGLLV